MFPSHDRGGGIYELPTGEGLRVVKGRQHFWNYDYFFKDKETTRKEFWRFSRAYHRYFNKWTFGETEEKSFDVFWRAMESRHASAPYDTKLEDHPKWIRSAVETINPNLFGHSAWDLV